MPTRGHRPYATHGTATPDNDVAEINAMRSVFGNLPLFCSMKETSAIHLPPRVLWNGIFSVRVATGNRSADCRIFATR